MPLRPCSRRGGGSLPPRQVRSWPFAPRTHHTQIVFHGAAYEYSYFLLIYLLNYVTKGKALACLPLNHNFLTLSQGFQRFVLQPVL